MRLRGLTNPLFEKQLPLFRDIHIDPIDWDEVQMKPASEDIHEVAAASQMADAYDVTPLKMWNTWELLGGDSQDYYTTNPRERERVIALAQKIRTSGWFSPIIVAVEDFEGGDPEPYILEGQHRARAVQILGSRVVPGYGVVYFETE